MSAKSVLGDDPFTPHAGKEPEMPAATPPDGAARAAAEPPPRAGGGKSRPATKSEPAVKPQAAAKPQQAAAKPQQAAAKPQQAAAKPQQAAAKPQQAAAKPQQAAAKPQQAAAKSPSADPLKDEGDASPPQPPRARGGVSLEDGAAARRAARITSVPGGHSDVAESPVDRLMHLPGGALEARPSGALERVTHRYARWMAEVRMRDRSDTVDEFGFDPVVAERWRPLLEFLFRSYWRVETSGIENIPDRDGAMIVGNHAGTFPYDGAMIMSAVKYDHPAHRDVRPLVEDFIFHFPFLGVALNRIGCVRACPENAERLLRHGGLVAVFPEGVKGIGKLYRQRYQLQRFGRGGFVKLALQTRVPIIPAAVIGAEEIHPMLGRVTWLAKYLGIPYVPLTPTFPWLGPLGTIPLPTKWQIRFGEPINLAEQHGPAAAEDRVLVHRLTEQVRSTIQTMVDEALLSRRTLFFG